MYGGLAITSEDVAKRLEAFSTLDDVDRSLLRAVAMNATAAPPGTKLLEQGQAIGHPRLLTAGWAWRTRALPNGRRQVFALVLPGDFVGLCWRPSPRALASTVAITQVQTCDASALLDVVRAGGTRHPALWRALTLASRHDEMRLLDQVVRLGRQTAVERVASFFLEIYERLRVVGLAEAGAFTMPLTQEAMADALGLSPVHVNRTLQQLRRDGLAELSGARVTLHQPGALSRLCGFEEAARAYAEAV